MRIPILTLLLAVGLANGETFWSAKDGVPYPWNPGWPALWLSNSPSGDHHLLLDDDQAVLSTARGLLSGAIAMESLEEDPPTPPGGGGGGSEPPPQPYTNTVLRFIGAACYSNMTPLKWSITDSTGNEVRLDNYLCQSDQIYLLPGQQNAGRITVLWTNPEPYLFTSDMPGGYLIEFRHTFDGTNDYIESVWTNTLWIIDNIATSRWWFCMSLPISPVTVTEVVEFQGQVGYSNYTYCFPLETTNRAAWANYTLTNHFTNSTLPNLYPTNLHEAFTLEFGRDTNGYALIGPGYGGPTPFDGAVFFTQPQWQKYRYMMPEDNTYKSLKAFFGSSVLEQPNFPKPSPLGPLDVPHSPFFKLPDPKSYSPPIYYKPVDPKSFLNGWPENMPEPSLPVAGRDGVPDYEIHVFTNAFPSGMVFTAVLATNGWTWQGTNIWQW